jgi:hypothetical protein
MESCRCGEVRAKMRQKQPCVDHIATRTLTTSILSVPIATESLFLVQMISELIGGILRSIHLASVSIFLVKSVFSPDVFFADIVDIKPPNMEELTEVITSAQFHPEHCNIVMYSSSRGSIKLGDTRQAALCDNCAKILEVCSSTPPPVVLSVLMLFPHLCVFYCCTGA